MINLGAGAPQPHIDLGLVTHGPGHAWAVAMSVTATLPIFHQNAINNGGAA